MNGENFAKIGERSAVIAALRAKNNEKNCISLIVLVAARLLTSLLMREEAYRDIGKWGSLVLNVDRRWRGSGQ